MLVGTSVSSSLCSFPVLVCSPFSYKRKLLKERVDKEAYDRIRIWSPGAWRKRGMPEEFVKIVRDIYDTRTYRNNVTNIMLESNS